MRILVALGGNALLKRGEPMTAEPPAGQRPRRGRGPAPRSPSSTSWCISHGNGPQVGLLALAGARRTRTSRPYPLDVLGAETEGMIGYLDRAGARQPPAGRASARDDPHDGRGRPGRPGLRRPDEVRRPDLRRGRGRRASPPRRAGSFKPDGDVLAPRRAVAAAEADLRDPADPLAARPRRGRDLRRRRRDPDHVRAGRGAHPRRRRGGDRQGPRQRACSPASSTPTSS